MLDFTINHDKTVPLQLVIFGKINYQHMSLKKFFSNSFPTQYQQLNKFQIGIQIGSLLFIWDECEIIVPRKYFADPIMSITLDKKYPINKLEKGLDKLAKVVLDWNVKGTFKKKNDFIYSIIHSLEIHALIPRILEEYVDDLNELGFSTYSFRVHKPLRSKFSIKEKRVFFHDHKSLDEFVKKLLKSDPFFQFKYNEEFQFLKGIDDLFWRKYIKSQLEIKKVKNEIDIINKSVKDSKAPSILLKFKNLENEYEQLLGGQKAFAPSETCECPFLKEVEY